MLKIRPALPSSDRAWERSGRALQLQLVQVIVRGNLWLMSRQVWIAAILLTAAIFGVTKWLRHVHDEDYELWDFEAERLLDQALMEALGRRGGMALKQPESAKID